MHDKDVLAGAFADKSVHVERNAFDVAVDDGFHFDELRVHVVSASFGHRRKRVRGQPRPGRDAYVAALGFAAQIFSPRIINDVNLGGRIEGVDAGFSVAAQHDGPNVAGPHAVVADSFEHSLDDFIRGERYVNAVNLGGIDKALHVFAGAEDCRAGGQLVATNAFEDRRAVVNDVRHHVDGRVVPIDELAVMPNLVGLLDCHADSFKYWPLLRHYSRRSNMPSPLRPPLSRFGAALKSDLSPADK